jgi:hypothetical protein
MRSMYPRLLIKPATKDSSTNRFALNVSDNPLVDLLFQIDLTHLLSYQRSFFEHALFVTQDFLLHGCLYRMSVENSIVPVCPAS